MDEDTTGRTLIEELCFMLFFGLNRGKRHFLMTGALPSGTCICNKEEDDWCRKTRCTGQMEDMTSYFCKGAMNATAETAYSMPTGINWRMRGIPHPDVAHIVKSTWHASYHLSFFLFLLYCSEEPLLLLFLRRLWGVQHNSIWASPESKTKHH